MLSCYIHFIIHFAYKSREWHNNVMIFLIYIRNFYTEILNLYFKNGKRK